jgi:hypothetical protein
MCRNLYKNNKLFTYSQYLSKKKIPKTLKIILFLVAKLKFHNDSFLIPTSHFPELMIKDEIFRANQISSHFS